MGYAAVNLQQGIRRVVLSQALLTLVVATGIWVTRGTFDAASAG
jgi:hypothetical protein